MASGVDTLLVGGSLPSKRAPPSSYRRGYTTSARRFPMPEMEESQFLLRTVKDTRQKLPVSGDKAGDDDEEGEGAWVTLLVQSERLVVVRDGRSWGWRLGCVKRYGYSTTLFYFESGRKSRTGKGMYTFETDCGERIHARITMVKEFCQFDLYCQRGVILDLLRVDDSPTHSRSFKHKSERTAGQSDKKDAGQATRRVSTGSLPTDFKING